jgi:tRNA (mo5U34)-methyltransferase
VGSDGWLKRLEKRIDQRGRSSSNADPKPSPPPELSDERTQGEPQHSPTFETPGEMELVLPSVVDPELLKRLTFSRPWFHTIDLGYGVVTPGMDPTADKIPLLDLPDSFEGKTVLDVGAYDGFFSFEAERRGAARVLATDHYCWTHSQENPIADGCGFDIAHWALESSVEKRLISVEDISPSTVGTFDYVFFLGVLYHSPDPLGYLRNVASVCSDTLIVETHVDGLDYKRPMMVFYPGETLNGDGSNFWGPNRQCVHEMLREVGFNEIREVSHTGKTKTPGAHPHRIAFHARR